MKLYLKANRDKACRVNVLHWKIVHDFCGNCVIIQASRLLYNYSVDFLIKFDWFVYITYTNTPLLQQPSCLVISVCWSEPGCYHSLQITRNLSTLNTQRLLENNSKENVWNISSPSPLQAGWCRHNFPFFYEEGMLFTRRVKPQPNTSCFVGFLSPYR